MYSPVTHYVRLPRDIGGAVFSGSHTLQKRESRMTALFIEALRVFYTALSDDAWLVQKEGLKGIANLAVDDQLSVGIVDQPLRKVISVISDHEVEPELKEVGDQIFRNLGFENGFTDYERIAGRQFPLLVDW